MSETQPGFWTRLRKAVAGAPTTKASRTARLIALQGPGRPVWTPRDYAALAREGFQQNPVVYRSIRMIAEAAAAVPLLLYEGARELDTHPLLALVARPNSAQAGQELLEALYGFLLASGNAYLECVEVAGAPRELHALRPDRMKLVPGARGWPAAYEYSVAGRSVTFRVEGDRSPILHLKLFHPTDDHYGLSPLEAAARAADLHNAASDWNKALLDNAARPSGALVYRGPDGAESLTREQYELIKQELEAAHQGPSNAGRPMILEGGLDWTPMALSPKDLDFIEAKHVAAREIALAFGVPPMLLGIPGDNTYANYREANLAFWRGTVLPLVKRTAGALSGWLGPRYGGELRLGLDLDQVEALSVEREALWARIALADFLSDAEKREAVGYGESKT